MSAAAARARSSEGASTAPSEPPPGTGCAGPAGARSRLLRHNASWRPTPWLVANLALVLAAGGLPLAWMAVEAIRAGALSLQTLITPRALVLLANTVLLGLVVAALSGIAGTALAVLATKTDLPWRRGLGALLTLPLFLPPYVLALGWFTVLGREGLLAQIAGPAAAIRTSGLFFGFAGAALVLTIAYAPISFHLVRIALGAIDPAAEEVARLHARWPRILRRISIPLVAPSVALAMLLTFVLVIGELGVPAYLRVPVFTTEVFAQFAAFLDIGGAVAMSLPLAFLLLAGLAIERYTLRHRVVFLPRHRVDVVVAPLGRRRVAVGALAWAWVLLTVLSPVAGLLIRARGPASYAVALRGAGASIVQSLTLSAVSATLILGAGVLLAYLVERSGRGRREGLDTLLLLLFAAPGAVLGVGLILVWNRTGLVWLYGSAAIIVVGYLGHLAPLAARIIGRTLRTLPPGVEDAARLAGVRWGRAFRGVVLPMIRPALAGAWALAFIFCMRDLDLTVTVYPPGSETLPVRAYTLMANSPEPVVAALAVVMVALTAVIATVGGIGLAAVQRATR